MKRNWLRGLLLGVSLALLLGGGVALAQSVSITPYCYWCCDELANPRLCDGWFVDSSGWPSGEDVGIALSGPGNGTGVLFPAYFADQNGDLYFDLYFMCEGGDYQDAFGQAYAAIYNDWDPGDYGEWTMEMEFQQTTVVGHFFFAEDPGDCEVEFVPEPGSILLLGSGLAGLAGYATLRWRARE